MTDAATRRMGKGHPAFPLLVGVVFFGLAVQPGFAGSVPALTGAAFLLWAIQADRSRTVDKGPPPTRLGLAVALFAAFSALGWAPSTFGPTSTWLEVLPGPIWLLVAVGTYVTIRAKSALGHQVVVLSTLAVSLVIGLIHLSQIGNVGIDVLFLHTEAADAITDGANPYTDAVTVPDGSPLAEPGDVIQGYVYPPVTMLGYAVGEWLFSDPRIISLASWLGVLTIIGVSAVRRMSSIRLYVMLLLAAVPGWPLVLRASWTEPFTLLTIVVAWIAWNRAGPSGAGLGLTLASKQYFVVTAPLLLLHKDSKSWARVAVAAAIVVITVGGAFLLDPGAYWASTVEFHASTPPRPDSANLVGLLSLMGISWDPPFWLAAVAGVGTAWALGRRSTSPGSFVGVMAASLAMTFLFSSQAFANYWFLIFGMTALTFIDVAEKADPSEQVSLR